MVRRLVVVCLLVATLAGCETVADLHSRYVWGRDCRPDHLRPDGQCTPTR